MKFYGTNNLNIELIFKEIDNDHFEYLTGLKNKEKFEYCNFNLIIENEENIQVDGFISNIFLSELIKLTNWFEQLNKEEDIETNISIYHNQLNFTFIKNEDKFKVIHISYDGSIPIPGNSGLMEIKEIGNDEYIIKEIKDIVYNKYIIESKIDDIDLERIIINLKMELTKLI